MARDIDRAGQINAAVAGVGAARAPISVRALLEWAFSVEKARVDFSEFGRRRSVGIEAVLMAQGCRVDGGGVSAPASDAEIVAAVVSALPVAQGGRSMAAHVAGLARARMAPDWMPGAVPRLVPVEWKRASRHGGPMARTDLAGHHVEEILVRNPRNPSTPIRRQKRHEIRYCPCRWSPSADRIAAARRHYLDWWGALLHLQGALKVVGLERYEVTGEMPELTPWR